MKRFIIALLFFLLIPATAYGEINTQDYNDYLSSYDFSFFEETLNEETNTYLEQLGIEDFSFERIYSMRFKDVLNIVGNAFKNGLRNPLEGMLSVLIFVVLSSFFQSVKSENDEMSKLFSTVSALTVSVLLLVKVSRVISAAAMSIHIAADFVYAFVPVFAAIVAASGGITVSFSTNALLLTLSQGLSILSSDVFMPTVNCFLALGITSSLKPELSLDRIVDTLRKMLLSALSFLAGAYVSVLSLKTAASARVDVLGLRSLRFVISSVVPVIGGALSEGLVSIQTYSSLIKSSVGIVGIIAVVLVFLPALCEIVLWRILLSVSASVSEIFGETAVSCVLRAFTSSMLIINVILIISALTTVVSIGVLIAAGN